MLSNSQQYASRNAYMHCTCVSVCSIPAHSVHREQGIVRDIHSKIDQMTPKVSLSWQASPSRAIIELIFYDFFGEWEVPQICSSPNRQIYICQVQLLHYYSPMGVQSTGPGDCAAQLRNCVHWSTALYIHVYDILCLNFLTLPDYRVSRFWPCSPSHLLPRECEACSINT